MTKLTLGLILAMLALTPTLVPAQEDGRGPDDPQPTEETIKAMQEALDGLEQAAKNDSEVDQIHYAKAVGERYKLADPKQQKEAVSILDKLLNSKNADIRKTAVEALARTGGRATRVLLSETKGRRKKDITHLCLVIAALGKLKDPKAVDPLLKFLNHKDDIVVAQAISAFGDYASTETKVRKTIVDKLLKFYASVASAANKTNPATSDKQRYDALYTPFESTLKILTKETTVSGANNWNRWYRKEGKKKKEW